MKSQDSDRAGAHLSWTLRLSDTPGIRHRRRLALLALTATGAMGLISLYQVGLIHHLPEPPVPRFDADLVDASPEAYQRLSTPDAALGLASYAVTLVLATMGGADRARRRPWIPLLLAGKLVFDTANAGRLTVAQWRRHRAFCFWCLLAAGATFSMVPTAWPEARSAWHSVLHGR